MATDSQPPWQMVEKKQYKLQCEGFEEHASFVFWPQWGRQAKAALQSQHPVGLMCKAEAPLCDKGSTQTSGSQGVEYRNLDHHRVPTVLHVSGNRVMRSVLFQFVARVHVLVTRVVAAGSSLITCWSTEQTTSYVPGCSPQGRSRNQGVSPSPCVFA